MIKISFCVRGHLKCLSLCSTRLGRSSCCAPILQMGASLLYSVNGPVQESEQTFSNPLEIMDVGVGHEQSDLSFNFSVSPVELVQKTQNKIRHLRYGCL